MKAISVIFANMIVVFFGCAVVQAAADCSAKDQDDRLRLIDAARSCETAGQINDACMDGAGSDTIPTAAVISRCEGQFKSQSSTAQMKAYDRALVACERKYATHPGTMYRSLSIYCQEHVAIRYALRMTRRAR